jgi:arylsulfatase A-like enzyme
VARTQASWKRAEAPKDVGRDELTAGRPPAAVVGALLGAVGGLVFAGWEAALLTWAHLPVPEPGLAEPVLAAYAVVGAVLGFLSGLTGFVGARWLALFTTLGCGWVLAGPLAETMAAEGLLPHFGLLVSLGVAGILGAFLAVMLPRASMLVGVTTTMFVATAVAVPANVHLLGAPVSALSLTADALVVLAGVLLGAVLAAFAGDGGVLRTVIGLVGLGAAGWGATFAGLPLANTVPTASASGGPPIVLVVVDALRADHLRAYGYDRQTAPNLDAFERRALVYADATAAGPWTLPSMASLLTGRIPSKHGAGLNYGTGSSYDAIKGDVPTLAQRLSAKGYTSAAVVTSRWAGASYGFHRGFDRYDDRAGPSTMPLGLMPLMSVYLRPVPWTDYRPAANVTDEAIAFVQAQQESQWFLLVHYMDVHGPLRPDPEDVEAVGKPRGSALVEAYDASIHEVDRHLGRLLAQLPKNAVIVITADHGDEIEEGRQYANPNPTGERHGHSMYQEVLRVPLLVAGPGVGAGRVTRPVSLVDVTPTLLALAGADPVESDGFALSEITGGEVPRDRAVIAEGIRWGAEMQMARVGGMKLIRSNNGKMAYDLARDAAEKQSLTGTSSRDLSWLSELEARLRPIGSAAVSNRPGMGAEVSDLVDRVR